MSTQNLFRSSFPLNQDTTDNLVAEIATENSNLGIVANNSEVESFAFTTPTTSPTSDSPFTPSPTPTTTPTPSPNPTTNPGTVIPSVDPDFTFSGAYDLGVINGSLNVQESVGGTDQGDGYQFTIATAGTYNFSLDGLSADADLVIFDSVGEIISLSENGSSQAENISLDLSQGTYFIGVASYDGVLTDYSLDITSSTSTPTPTVPNPTTPSPSTEDPGETFETALDLGLFADNSVYVTQDQVGSSDPIDLYEFSLNQTTEIELGINNLSADVDLYVLDSQGELLGSSENGGTNGELLAGSLSSGTYYLGVVSYDGVDSNYTLGISTGNSDISFITTEVEGDMTAIESESSFV